MSSALTFAREPPRAVDIGMRHGPAGIGLERDRLGHPARAEIADHLVVVAVERVGEAVEQAVHALEHRARPVEAGARQQRRAHARLRRPAGMHALGPGALGEIFDDARRHRADHAERIDDLLLVRARAPRRRRPPRPWRRRSRSDGSRPCAPSSAPPCDSRHMVSTPTAMPSSAARAVRIVPLAGREHRRHDHRAGMHRAALEGVVEILAMRRGAVDEGGAGRAHGARVADRGAGAVVLPAGERGLDVVVVARGDAEARRRRSAGPRRCARTAAGSLPASSAAMRFAEMLGDGGFGQVQRPFDCTRMLRHPEARREGGHRRMHSRGCCDIAGHQSRSRLLRSPACAGDDSGSGAATDNLTYSAGAGRRRSRGCG